MSFYRCCHLSVEKTSVLVRGIPLTCPWSDWLAEIQFSIGGCYNFIAYFNCFWQIVKKTDFLYLIQK